MNDSPIVEILSQGEELITGQIVDTNAAWLSQHVINMGFTIRRHSTVGDNLADLEDILQTISQRADVCLCTGGLGPTVDDLTTEAVAKAFVKPLQLDPVALQQITAFFAIRQRGIAEINRKQAFLPQGSQRIDNHWGTAPGFALQQQRCWFIFLPGVPSEMKNMFKTFVKNDLMQRFTLHPKQLVTIKTIGIGESDLQQIINDIALDSSIALSFRATPQEVQTKLLFAADTDSADINTALQPILEKLGETVFAVDKHPQTDTDLMSVISHFMKRNQRTLSILETLSQGLIAAQCIGQEWLLNAYCQPTLKSLLTQSRFTPTEDLTCNAKKIAQRFQLTENADIVLVQLYQDNENALQDSKQAVLLYNVLITEDGIQQQTLKLAGSIQHKQQQAALYTLDLLRRYLQYAPNTTE